MAVIYGFGGMRIKEGMLYFDPLIPEKWESISFKIMFRKNILLVKMKAKEIQIENESGPEIHILLKNEKVLVSRGQKKTFEILVNEI